MNNQCKINDGAYQIKNAYFQKLFSLIDTVEREQWVIKVEAEGGNSFYFEHLYFTDFNIIEDLISNEIIIDDEAELAIQMAFINDRGIKIFDTLKFKFGKWDKKNNFLEAIIEGYIQNFNVKIVANLKFIEYSFYGYSIEQVVQKAIGLGIDINKYKPSKEIMSNNRAHISLLAQATD